MQDYQQVDDIDKLTKHLTTKIARKDIHYYDKIDSTNTFAKGISDHASHGSLIIANSQTDGHGRFGKTFDSPLGGVYMSIIIKNWQLQATALTALAAISVCQAVQAFVDRPVQIKWINDITIDNKKVCGISCQTRQDCFGLPMWHLVGIGLNIYTDISAFDLSIQDKVSSLKYYAKSKLDKYHIIAKIVDGILSQPSKDKIFEQYSSLIPFFGKPITVQTKKGQYQAIAQSLTQNFELVVQTQDGLQTLKTEEVSILPIAQ